MSTDPLVEAVAERVIALLRDRGLAPPDIIPLQEAADKLGLNHMTLRSWHRQGRLPLTRLGARVYLTQQDYVKLTIGELPLKKGTAE